MKKIMITFLYFSTAFSFLIAQDAPLWMRYPAISPDGNMIVFSYQGDLYKVAANGGSATALTLHEAHDYEPVWSNDGKQIAFASDRYGNFDVYVMPAEGGKAKRLTYHSANDKPSSFTPDNQNVMFYSSRLDAATNQQYPSGVLPELYEVPAAGGRVSQTLTTPALGARWNKNGDVLVFHDRKGYEDTFRKHHTSSVARDIWKYEKSSDKYTQLTTFPGEDRNPVFAQNQADIYYLSEEKGTYNVFQLNINNPTEKRQITQLEKHPVRYLTVSDNGKICFSFNGEIYTKTEGNRAEKVTIQIASDARYNEEKIVKAKKASEIALSPNGKEVAFVNRGEIFVSSIKEGTTKRITNTPEQERNISFSKDGRAILYAGEREGSWNIYQTKIGREEEKYFFNSTILEEETVIATAAEEFQPAYSPDGKEVAYLEERTALKVVNLESKAARLIVPGDKNYSYSDGDQYYAWSPDSKWFLVEFLQDNQWINQVGLVSAEGGKEVVNLTKSGYGNYAPKWAKDGSRITWFSDRDGMKNDASWGGQMDVYAMYLTQAAYDKYKLNEEEYELLTEEEKEEAKEKKKEEKKEEDEKKDKDKVEPIKIELEGIADRKVRLTRHSSRLSDAILSKDGEKLYYLARFEKGPNLWETTLRTGETKLKTKLGSRGAGGLVLDKEGKNLFLLADGKINKIGLSDGKKKGIGMKGEMVLNETLEREYLFEHIWRQVEKKFYKIDIHNVEWEFYKKEYARFLPHINNNYDFAEMLSELLGELNASHTGARYRNRMENGDQTASLGLFYDND